MRLVIQRVHRAHVEVAEETVGAIDRGLLVYLGVGAADGESEIAQVVNKVLGLRVFETEQGVRSVGEVGGGVLLISQFTLYGDIRKGRRPSFAAAAPAEQARELYGRVVAQFRASGVPIATGRFQAEMAVYSLVDGPYTLLFDTERRS